MAVSIACDNDNPAALTDWLIPPGNAIQLIQIAKRHDARVIQDEGMNVFPKKFYERNTGGTRVNPGNKRMGLHCPKAKTRPDMISGAGRRGERWARENWL